MNDRYRTIMDAASRIAAVLITKGDAKPIETAVTLAFELEMEVQSALESVTESDGGGEGG